jgi:hypothetical protein
VSLSRPLLAVIVGAVGALAAAPGCGAGYPPVVGSEGPADSGSDTIQLTPTESGPPPSCKAATKGGICGCTDLPLLTPAPNLFFLLDRSGSMNESNKWYTIRVAIAEMMSDIGPRASFGAAVFPAPGADPASCAPGVIVSEIRRGDSPAGSYGPTTENLITETDLPASGGTPTAATVLGLTDHLAALHEKTFAILATDGGPNCDADVACSSDDCILNIESGAEGCVPNGTLDCCSPSAYGPLNCLDGSATINAIAALAARGVATFIMGIPGSGPYANLLDKMAQAGGTARAEKPYYYPVETIGQAAFYDALSKIGAKATGTCVLPLGTPPTNATEVNVYLSGKVVPRSGPNGWTYSGDGGSPAVTLLGKSCSEVLEGDVLDVRVIEGCPTVEK